VTEASEPTVEFGYPNLAGIASADLVSQIGAGSYKADYINWARTLQLLRENAPGWLPELVLTDGGAVVHPAPVGGFLLIRFRHIDGQVTPAVPQAVMNNKNNAVPYGEIDARDVSDTHRRGACLAACFTFGLAYELWAKMPLESGFADKGEGAHRTPDAGVPPAVDRDGWIKEIAKTTDQATFDVTKQRVMEDCSTKNDTPAWEELKVVLAARGKELGLKPKGKKKESNGAAA
jgi:hypothetical protein